MTIRARRANQSDGSCSACNAPADCRYELSSNGYQSLIIRLCTDCLTLLNEATALAMVPKVCVTCGK